MPATVTLSTTTLSVSVAKDDTQINVASTAGLFRDIRLYVDREMMRVISLGVGTQVNVARGVDGTATAPHASSAVVTIGRPEQFYSSDPVGRPPESIPVSPYINVLNGTFWFARGDASATSNRWWQKQTTTYGVAAFGIGTQTLDPTVST